MTWTYFYDGNTVLCFHVQLSDTRWEINDGHLTKQKPIYITKIFDVWKFWSWCPECIQKLYFCIKIFDVRQLFLMSCVVSQCIQKAYIYNNKFWSWEVAILLPILWCSIGFRFEVTNHVFKMKQMCIWGLKLIHSHCPMLNTFCRIILNRTAF